MVANKRYTRNRRVVRRGRVPRTIVIKPRIPLNGVQNTEIIKLRYATQISIPGGAGHGSYQFRANSLFDPDLSGVGHQPMGFDEMSARYLHYQVLGSRIKVSPIINGTSPTQGDAPSWVMVSLAPNNLISYTNFSSVLESKPYGKTKKVCVSNYSTYSNNGVRNKDEITLSSYYDPKKMFGLNKATLNANEDLKALVNANPAEDANFQIQAFPIADNGQRDTIHLLVEIDYTAKFSEPKQIPAS